MTPAGEQQTVLPVLPEPAAEARWWQKNAFATEQLAILRQHPMAEKYWGDRDKLSLYTADQMREYATKALQEAAAKIEALNDLCRQNEDKDRDWNALEARIDVLERGLVAAHAAAEARIAVLEAQNARLRQAGAPMANTMFNLAQQPGEMLTPHLVQLFDKMRRAWDAANEPASRTA